MTVKELRDELKKVDQSAKIMQGDSKLGLKGIRGYDVMIVLAAGGAFTPAESMTVHEFLDMTHSLRQEAEVVRNDNGVLKFITVAEEGLLQ